MKTIYLLTTVNIILFGIFLKSEYNHLKSEHDHVHLHSECDILANSVVLILFALFVLGCVAINKWQEFKNRKKEK